MPKTIRSIQCPLCHEILNRPRISSLRNNFKYLLYDHLLDHGIYGVTAEDRKNTFDLIDNLMITRKDDKKVCDSLNGFIYSYNHCAVNSKDFVSYCYFMDEIKTYENRMKNLEYFNQKKHHKNN